MTGSARGRAGALALSGVLLAAGLLGVSVANHVPLDVRLPWLWLALVPAYLLAYRFNLEFERRDGSVGITLVQLPLALGVVLVEPWLHLAARLLATVLLCAVRRHDPLKATVNVALAAMEVGVVAAAVSVVGPLRQPQPALWGALLIGLFAAEIVSVLALHALFRVLSMPVTRRQLLEHGVSAMLAVAVFSAVSVLTIAAAWTDRWTLLVVLVLAGAMAGAYRGHRRQAAQQRATEALYEFVRALGPVDVLGPAAVDALVAVRELLHAVHLELAAYDEQGVMSQRIVVHLNDEPEMRPADSGLPVALSPRVSEDCMRTPLLAGDTVVGLLIARERIGTDRGFDMRDLRLLETVAAELATAMDRGRLLRQLGHAAATDPLTGLPNLRQVNEELRVLLLDGASLVLCVVAVDSFREVNDTLGHEVGDELLREVALRLQTSVPDALLARIGGGRFAVSVPAEAAGNDPAMFGLGLRARVEGPAQLGAISTHVRLSVGCVRAPEDGSDASTLLRRAETAMYSAQHAHGGPVLWEPAHEVQGQRRLAVVTALREALAAGAIGVAFQPKISALTGGCTGVEALARWTHPALGVIPPDEFVPLAEASGLMGALTTTIMLQALTACRSWQPDNGGSGVGVGVAVNVSADTLQDQDFVTEVSTVLASTDVDAALLTLELTENVVVADPQLAAERMRELRALGVRLSVDDFGTGYSSLTYLKGLPIDEVKIDRGFVACLVKEPGDQAVVRAVVDIAHTLGVSVVAEGVEQEDQQLLLRRLRVDELQGYLHARPMPASDIAVWLRRREHAERDA